MDISIVDDIKKNLYGLLIKKYQPSIPQLRELGGYQNFIYELYKDNKFYIIRITCSNHRTKE